MGLDMYLIGRKHHRRNFEDPAADTYMDGYRVAETVLDLGYWRKHPNLHGYIVQNYAGGVDECQDIPLEVEDLRKIRAAVVAGDLPETTGFFFGQSDGTEKDEDLRTLDAAIEWASAEHPDDWSRTVVYRASW